VVPNPTIFLYDPNKVDKDQEFLAYNKHNSNYKKCSKNIFVKIFISQKHQNI
jgi:hypothetical protein